MSDVALVDAILSEGESNRVLEMAVKEARKLFSVTGVSLADVCTAVEGASSREELQKSLAQFNLIMHIFLELRTVDGESRTILDGVGSLPSSARFQEILVNQHSLVEAIQTYKKIVVKELASRIRRRKTLLRSFQLQDRDLLDSLLPEEEVVEAPKKKRARSPILDEELFSGPKKKKGTIPALASVGFVTDACDTALSAKKTLMTRERLRAGLHDPKGLLCLVGPSTDALERTKRLELLKSAGGRLNDLHRNASFSEKFNAAKWRLDLGLAGQVHGDTLLFGKRALSNPGSLSHKNVSDIENNIIDGKTT